MNITAVQKHLMVRNSGRPFTPSPLRTARLILATKAWNTLVTRNFKIATTGRLDLSQEGVNRFGTAFYGFADGSEKSLIRVRGHLEFQGSITVAAGARWDIGPDATVTIGPRTYFSPDTMLVAMHRVSVGSDCAIGWGVQILDADFHAHGQQSELGEASASDYVAPVQIGDHVWIGSHAKIYKGVTVAGGCIVAGNATVTRSVTQPNSLIAGSPARVVRSNVEWK
ncbi:acyltransferase [Arthrobacter sp. TMS2-4]